MSNATPSRLGQVNAANDVDALWLKLFGGMVITYMQKASVVLPNNLVMRKSITAGKSAQFPMTGLATASYHTPGAEILGTAVNHAEKVITLDQGILHSASFIAELDKRFDHFDADAPYAMQQGDALGNILDQHLLIEHIKGARETSAIVTGTPSGYTSDRTIADDSLQIAVGEGAGAASIAAQAEAFLNDLTTIATGMDNTAGCPSQGRFIIVRPNLYNNIVRAVQSNGFGLANSRYNGNSANIGDASISKLMGFTIYKSANLPSSNLSASGNYTYHAADCRKTVAVAGVPGSVALLDNMDVKVEKTYDPRRFGWLITSRYLKGAGWLRQEFLWELTLKDLTQVVLT